MGVNEKDITERTKFQDRRDAYNGYLEWVGDLNIDSNDFLHNSTAYISHMHLNRILTIYELYKKVNGVAGHIAEVGVFKGAGALFFAKLVKLFEPESFTCVHGFDRFDGTSSNKNGDAKISNCKDYEMVVELTRKQSLDGILKLHKIDIIQECADFFERFPQLRFKLVFMDIGSYEVMKEAIPLFWKHLVPQGIMIFDHYSLNDAPGETIALSEFLPNVPVHTIANSWTPNAYIIKEGKN